MFAREARDFHEKFFSLLLILYVPRAPQIDLFCRGVTIYSMVCGLLMEAQLCDCPKSHAFHIQAVTVSGNLSSGLVKQLYVNFVLYECNFRK